MSLIEALKQRIQGTVAKDKEDCLILQGALAAYQNVLLTIEDLEREREQRVDECVKGCDSGEPEDSPEVQAAVEANPLFG